MSQIIQITPWDDFGFYLDDFKEATDDEFKAWVDLNSATDNFLKGRIDIAEYTDYLSHYEINVEDHLKPVDWYLTELDK